ncbi:APC family permease [Brevibacterium litoralis]|uniref:APC family permease n=1 Tax=Brevibacterium litoralis TaxID=3138935 RepID=UPI0032EF11F1
MSALTSTPHDRGFAKVLGSFETLLFGFGAMIGFGWITSTGGWLDDAGLAGAVIAFGIGGVIMVLVGLVYSELVSAMPLAGGEHNYLIRAMGPKASVFGSWAIAGGYISVVLFEAVAAPRTFGYMIPGLTEAVPMYTVAGYEVGLIWALIGSAIAAIITWVNIRGVKVASLVQTFVVLFIVFVMLLFVIGIFVGGETANAEPFFGAGATPVAGIVAVIAVVPFFFVGFDVIPQSAEELRIPARRIGIVLLWSVVAAVAFYMIIIVAVGLGMSPADRAASEESLGLVTADALGTMFGGAFWTNVVLAGGAAGIITSWIAFMAGSSRLLWAMGNSGMIPAWFSRMHPRYKTPVNALLFIGVLAVIAPFGGVAVLVWAVDAGSPMITITYFLVAIAFLVLRRKETDMDRPFTAGRGGLGVLVGIIAAVLTGILTILYIPGLTPWSTTLAWQSYLICGVWLLVGVVFALRLPAVKAGPDAEHDLLAALSRRRSR